MGGHTVNYTIKPAPPPNQGQHVVCLSEPQHSDPDADKCCWLQNGDECPSTNAGSSGAACYAYRCGSQARDEGGACVDDPWPTPSDGPDCGSEWNSAARECCQDKTSYWDNSLSHACSQDAYDRQHQDRCDHYAECVNDAGAPIPPGVYPG
jgi:hypothetical protein